MHQSLARSEGCTPEILRYFDIEGTDVLLYELRFLSADVRPAVATYIAQHNLEPYVRSDISLELACHCLQHALSRPEEG